MFDAVDGTAAFLDEADDDDAVFRLGLVIVLDLTTLFHASLYRSSVTRWGSYYVTVYLRGQTIACSGRPYFGRSQAPRVETL